MGSVRPPSGKKQDEISVLVTGFGAFQRHTNNPSWMILQSLPEVIPGYKGARTIRLYARPEPVKVTYKEVREQIPPLLFSTAGFEDSGAHANFDLVLHMGVSYARGYYEMETRAFRDDYKTPDVDGETGADGHELWKDEGAPEMLQTGFDSKAVLVDWKKNVDNHDVRQSLDAGRFLCEYILFTSLLEYSRKKPGVKAPVTFLHVPAESEPADIERGRDVAVGLIKALAAHRPRKT